QPRRGDAAVRAHLHGVDALRYAPCDPADILGFESTAPEHLLGPHDDPVRWCVDLEHERLGRARVDTEAAPLPDGVAVDPRMFPENSPVAPDDLPWRDLDALFNEAAGVAVGHEADLVGVGLVGGAQADLARQRS